MTSNKFFSTVAVNSLHSDYRHSSLRQKRNKSIKVSEIAEIIGQLTIAVFRINLLLPEIRDKLNNHVP